jgi:hypothetical protein
VPVVVRTNRRERDVLVLGLEEELPAELRERREVHRRQHTGDVHIADALVDVVATGPHLVEAGGLGAVLVPGSTRHRVEADVARLHPFPHPRLRAVVLLDDPGRAVLVLRRHPSLEQVPRLDHVVVDRHEDEVVDVHENKP